MESKQMTLRSQTVRCPHCGEYYSVTYKYCPFCDAGRKAEEQKKAARKQHAASLFGGLFGGGEEEAPVSHSGHSRPPRQSSGRGERPSQRRQAPVSTSVPPSAGFRKKKTSEMTEEEKKAYRAEREARAAARKRERDRAARAAGLMDLNDLTAPGEGLSPAEAVRREVSPSGMETVEITLNPMNTPPADLSAPAEPVSGPSEAAPESPDDEAAQVLLDVNIPGQEDQMMAAPVDMDSLPVEETVPPAAEAPAPQQEAAPQETSAPQQEADPAALLPEDSELDSLLSEIRGLLGEGGAAVTPAAPRQAAAPQAQTAQGTQAPQEAAPVQEAASAQEAAPAQEATADQQAAPAQEAAPVQQEAPVQEAAAPQQAAPAQAQAPQTAEPAPAPVQNQTAQAQPAEAVQEAEAAGEEFDQEPSLFDTPSAAQLEGPELLWSPETTAAVEASSFRRTQARQPRQTGSQTQTRRRRRKKRATPSLSLIVAAVVVIVVAALLMTKVIAPAIQRSHAADSVTLVQTELTLVGVGATDALTVVLEPEDAQDVITWTCSDWNVAGVDSRGVVTARAPGTAVVKATNLKGISASATITCLSEGDLPVLEGAGEPAPVEEAAPPEPGLSATEVTLDGEGKSTQLSLTGATGAVKWTSSKPAVATVSADGTVTAVSKGSATVTAESNGSKYNCNVRCVW